MNPQQATLLAASIAAVAAIFTLVGQVRASRAAEFRTAYRRTLESLVADLGEAIHEDGGDQQYAYVQSRGRGRPKLAYPRSSCAGKPQGATIEGPISIVGS